MNTLVIAPSWIGDSVLSLPLVQRLRESHPQGRIDVLAPAWVAPIYRRSPAVSAVTESPFVHGRFDLGARWRLGRHYATQGFDRAVVLPNTWKSALVPFFARIPRRAGFLGEARRILLNEIHPLDEKAVPQLAQRYALLTGSGGAPADLPDPVLRVDEAQRLATLARLGEDPAQPAVAFCPGAEFGPAKRWPVRYFAELARALEDAGYRIWLTGSGKDAHVGDQIADAAGKSCINLCGRTSLDEAIDVLASARLVVSNDSGLMHVAAALGRPLVGLFGSSSPHYTPPLSRAAEVVWLGLDCSPCFARVCPLGHLRCLDELTPARVLAAARRKLGLDAPAARPA